MSPTDIYHCENMLLQKFSWNINLCTPIDVLHQLFIIAESKGLSKKFAPVFQDAEKLVEIMMVSDRFKHESIDVIAGGCLASMATIMTCSRASKEKMLQKMTPTKFIGKKTMRWSKNVLKHLRMLHDSCDNNISFDFLFKTSRVFLL